MLLNKITTVRIDAVLIRLAKEAAQELLGVSHCFSLNSLVSLRASRDIQNIITKAYDKAEMKSISREEFANASQSPMSLSKMFLMNSNLGCHLYLYLN